MLKFTSINRIWLKKFPINAALNQRTKISESGIRRCGRNFLQRSSELTLSITNKPQIKSNVSNQIISNKLADKWKKALCKMPGTHLVHWKTTEKSKWIRWFQPIQSQGFERRTGQTIQVQRNEWDEGCGPRSNAQHFFCWWNEGCCSEVE